MTRTEIGRFTSEKARERFLRAYEDAMVLWPQPRREADIDTGFGTVHVHRYGTGRGEPVVLLHGHGTNASTWYPQVAALGARHPVIAVDTIDDPGRSVQHTVVADSADNARWLNEVFAGLGLDRVHLVGHSYGGWLALNQAVHGPDRLASITLLDPGGLAKVPRRFYLNMVAGAMAMLAPRRLRPRLGRLLANAALLSPPELLRPALLASRTFRPGSRPPARVFADEELRSVSVPVFALLAGRSVLLNAAAAQARLQSLIPGVQAEVITKAGHGLALEQPDLINQRILRFLDAQTSAPERRPG
ncbi:carboxylesterase [Actinomadura viridis]|uniref:Pimeloyl-ACP methyl ester carboxylesterase n=1 Tax=Actinomadura viridis TaxID=58110 RepID=A0A931DJ17_9ACTN|nr:alpha/beta fold hydrolase [Actinomadura viridis]MBG6089634.1 pimeloyl-ACP methyl ester carboxylesterase [Actinomadura viridis]